MLIEGQPPRAYYDPDQIDREQALQVLDILAPAAARPQWPGGAGGGRAPEGERGSMPEGSCRKSQTRILQSMATDSDQEFPG